MQQIQEREIQQKEEKSRISRIERKFQGYMYRYAERRQEKSRWQAVISYLAILPIVAITLLLTFGLQKVTQGLFLRSGALVLAIAITSLLLGWGPALVLTFLGVGLLDYFIVTPYGEWSIIRWPEVLQLLPYCLAGITIGLLSRLRDTGWLAAREQARKLAEANQKLEDEARLRDRFLSMTSHELKTPITSIRMQLQLLQRQLKKQEAGKNASTLQALGKIDERTNALTEMIDELLDFSRSQQPQGTWRHDLLDMNALCQEVIEDQRLATGRTIQLQTAASPASVWGDAQRLAQVVNNLVSNASKYSPSSEAIEVVVESDQGGVIVLVRDHGQGIEQDQLAHIFEPFYRTPEAQSSAPGGLGLGLAITKQIVNFHHGRIWCESGKGRGSTFFVVLPFAAREQAREQHSAKK
ncbi:MAG TPA: HAMP domain-containing sensor histidine kinase [Ktedonobacteraceae bacterium]|nr:HAMP domain-containing sensor histidine kinase [Ktedonobacteraceae bacterium]